MTIDDIFKQECEAMGFPMDAVEQGMKEVKEECPLLTAEADGDLSPEDVEYYRNKCKILLSNPLFAMLLNQKRRAQELKQAELN